MIGQNSQEDVIFFVALAFLVAMLVCMLRGCWSQWRASGICRTFMQKLSSARQWFRMSRKLDEADHIVHEKMQRQKVSHVLISCQLAGVLLIPFTLNMLYLIATKQTRVHTLVQDVLHFAMFGMSIVVIARPSALSERTMDMFYVYFSLCIALYLTPWACRAEYMFEAVMCMNAAAISFTACRRSLPVCTATNAMITASACSLIWVHGGDCVKRPGAMIGMQAFVMGFITICTQWLDRSVASTIRQGLEAQAAREVLSAATALLKSCCDIVVELDLEGTIIGAATDLGSFLLRGPQYSLQGTPLVDLMATEEDRIFFKGKLSEQWSSGSSLAEVRHVRMKDGNSEILQLELLWFQFRHLDQQLRYMVGLKEFSDPAVRRTPAGAAIPADAPATRGPASAGRQPGPVLEGAPLPPAVSRADEDAGGSIPEAASVVSALGAPPVLVTVDSTENSFPISKVSEEFCKRIGRVSPGQSLVAFLRGKEQFSAWLQVAIQTCVYEDESAPDCRLIFRMPQGDMSATCRLLLTLEGEEDVPDLKQITLSLFDIKRRCSSSATPERTYFKGTPVKRLGL
eukprot:CAMPEP_0204563202 /NCGR_PEP_ID=MMETSP0661-20131031/34173_1 /ASSEMBLY_ACC=CAM_ASM_000606 /TAXON_ID=109239 /ORGANISM="Alexandrium margalefi, Strain AMGDE01CS-322" /LENGTH=570 /DNA_ID=CAMNT_0051570739 /DNA_START=80 /DNA_END=1792 /DNA_ORIENTATION=-